MFLELFVALKKSRGAKKETKKKKKKKKFTERHFEV